MGVSTLQGTTTLHDRVNPLPFGSPWHAFVGTCILKRMTQVVNPAHLSRNHHTKSRGFVVCVSDSGPIPLFPRPHTQSLSFPSFLFPHSFFQYPFKFRLLSPFSLPFSLPFPFLYQHPFPLFALTFPPLKFPFPFSQVFLLTLSRSLFRPPFPFPLPFMPPL